jgi:hypothetical protein
VRRYSGRNLEPLLIDELLDIACHAPTCSPWSGMVRS